MGSGGKADVTGIPDHSVSSSLGCDWEVRMSCVSGMSRLAVKNSVYVRCKEVLYRRDR